MFSIQVLAVLAFLCPFVCAQWSPDELADTVSSTYTVPKHSWWNNTNVTPTTLLPSVVPTGKAQKCCFLVQDTVSEVWWEQTAYTTEDVVVTTFSYFETVLPNTTITNTNSSVHTSTRDSSRLVGLNPNTLFYRYGVALPAQVATSLTGTVPITTGGTVVVSPAAFYVYSTVRIITADAVADQYGNYMCGTNSEAFGTHFTSINPNAQAYFSVVEKFLNIDGRSQSATVEFEKREVDSSTTFISPAATPNNPTATYTSVAPTPNAPAPTPTVLTLLEPYIYVPDFASKGLKIGQKKCRVGDNVEDYGYIPEKLFHHLIKDDYYRAQYPGLENCLPAGPAFEYHPYVCPSQLAPSFEATAIGGDLTELVTFRVNQQGMTPIKTKAPEEIPKPKEPENAPTPEKTKQEAPTPEKTEDMSNKVIPVNPDNGKPVDNGQSQQQSVPENKSNGGGASNNQGSQTKPADKPQDDSIGSIINSIIGGSSGDNTQNNKQPPVISNSEVTNTNNNNNNPIVYTAGEIVPVQNAPSGLTGDIKTVNGQSVYVISEPITIAPGPVNVANNVAGTSSVIDGTLFFIIPAATNVPLGQAPPGIQGSTILSNGKSYLAIPGPITYAVPEGAVQTVNNIGATKVIDGSTFLVIPSATNIPLSAVPAGLKGSTTVIDGKSYLAVAPVTYAPPNPQITQNPLGGTTLLIGDIPFVVYPSGREIPLSDALALGIGAGGITRTVDGKTLVSFSAPTTVAAINSADPGRGYGSTVLVDGTPYLVLPTGKPVPASLFPSGALGTGAKTTRINGEDFLIVSTATTVPLAKPTPGTTGSSKGISGGLLTVIIDGSSRLVIAGPTTMALNSYFDVEGSKTVISGTTMVVVTAATTVAAKSTSEESRIPTAIQPAPTGGSQAPDSGAERNVVLGAWSLVGVLVGVCVVLVV